MIKKMLGAKKLPYSVEDRILAKLHEGSVLKHIDEKDIFGETLLVRSLRYRMYKVASFLLDHGADLSVKDSGGRSALSYVLASGNPMLISSAVNRINTDYFTNDLYNSFLYLCSRLRGKGLETDLSPIHYLLDKVNLDLENTSSGESFIFFAIEIYSPCLVKLYIDRGNSLFVRNRWGMSVPTFLCYFKDRLMKSESPVSPTVFQRLSEIEGLIREKFLVS